MKKLVLIMRIATAIALAAFLALAPPRLFAALQRNPYREFLGGEKEKSWSGVITLWHVVEFKTWQGSVTAFLEGCAAQYEKANAGVYIEVVGLSPEAAMERLARGERPDIWSVPMGRLFQTDFLTLTLDTPALTEGLQPYARDGRVYALPYFLSGYYLIGNTVLVQDLGLSFPDRQVVEAARQGDVSALSTQMQAAMDSRSTQRYGALCAPPLLAAQWGVTGKLANEGDFKAGQVPFLVGDARMCGDLSRKMSADGFTFDAIALGGFTEQVQYAGIDPDIAEERLVHASAIMELLLSARQQAKLTALGALPAVQLDDQPVYADSQMTALFEAYQLAHVPDPALYSAQRDMLIVEAQNAVSGDGAAREAFEKRLQEIMHE